MELPTADRKTKPKPTKEKDCRRFSPTGLKTMRLPDKVDIHDGKRSPSSILCESEPKKARSSSKVGDNSSPLAVPNILEDIENKRYGSVTAVMKHMMESKRQKYKFLFALQNKPLDVEKKLLIEGIPKLDELLTSSASQHVIDLDDVAAINIVQEKNSPIIIIDSDDEDFSEPALDNQIKESEETSIARNQIQDVGENDNVSFKMEINAADSLTEVNCGSIDDDLPNEVNNVSADMGTQHNDSVIVDGYQRADSDNTNFPSFTEIEGEELNDQIVSEDDDTNEQANLDQNEIYNDGEIEEDEESDQIVQEYDDLEGIWNEMNFAMECSKDVDDNRSEEQVKVETPDCDHDFVRKEDIGYVCRVCGLVKQRIDTIIEYQFRKSTRSTRTYYREAHDSNDKETKEFFNKSSNLFELDNSVKDLSIHPMHGKKMKPHQLEGFKFLLSNLVTDNPGGCILAHAPGSGKTFVIISFMQSFLAKYPQSKPLVVLPKGILSTWKKEFARWQVEDIPLYDFYSEKADTRAQQLGVLKKWAGEKSIIFLGYKQLSTILCDDVSNETAVACQKILLQYPSILILDEGHTPRNEETDILGSLKKIETPRKVVLSGTLYQNHVKEVFNILELVSPKFLKQESARAIIKRVLSKVPNTSRASNLTHTFFESVESTLQNDGDFKKKISVIRDLREMTSKRLHFYKGDFLDELPGLEDFTVFLNLSCKQKEGVNELKKLNQRFKIISEGSSLYVHPSLRDYLKTSSKREKEGFDDENMDKIIEKSEICDGVKANFFFNILRLCETTQEKLLVFSQYIQPLKFLERLVVKTKNWSVGKEIFVITGDTNPESRDSSMDHFNNSSSARLFFGSIKACGEGISLVGGSRIIILDVHLNPSVTRQAIGRAFRPGQERKVYTYRLVAAESPEEDDHSICFRKESIAKMWFEWNEWCGEKAFEMRSVDVRECGDMFLESPKLSADIKSLYKR